MPTTEEDILKSVPGLEDVKNDTSTEQENTDAKEEGEVQEQAAQSGERSESADTESTVERGQTKEPPARTQQQQADSGSKGKDTVAKGSEQQSQPSRPTDGRWRTDEHGNVVIPAGAARRQFEDAIRFNREQRPRLEQELKSLQSTVATYKEVNALPTQLGLSPEQTAMSIRLGHLFINNPLQALTDLLTEVKRVGIDTSSLNMGGVDAKAIKAMVEEQLAPMRQREKQIQEERERVEYSQRQYGKFIERFPDAEIHADEIAHLLNRDPELTSDGAYHMLRNVYTRHGLDWNLPLNEAHAARGKNGSGQQQREVPPTGRGGNRATNLEEGSSAFDTVDDIVRRAMQQNGLLK